MDPSDSGLAAELGDLDVPALIERAEQVLLGGGPKYTRGQIVERAGIDLEAGRRLWRALGFASVEDDQVVFTDADVRAVQLVERLVEAASMDDELLQSMTRMLGQTFARLASWQGQLVVELLRRRPELLASEDQVLKLVDGLTDVMQDIQSYVWRRQLAAYFSRIATTSDASSAASRGAETALAVGFADMASFTTLSRRWSEDQLRSVLERFEATANEVISAHGGRVVKTIGDEVLFVADRPEDAATIALELLEATNSADDPPGDPGPADGEVQLPPLRIGVASGPVVQRFGDVYGSTVNIASRLTSIARPGSVLIDRVMSERLRDDDRFQLRSKRPESVRGYHHLHSWRLRRGPAATAEHRAG